MINFFLGVALVAAPFFIKMGAQTTTVASQEYFLMITTFFGVIFFGIRPHLNLIIMSILLFALAFTTHNPFGFFQYFQLIYCFVGVLFIALIYTHSREINKKLIYDIFAIICLIESTWIFAQEAGYNPHALWVEFLYTNYKTVTLNGGMNFGSLGNANHSGALIACTIPFLKPRYWFIPAIALYFTSSTMPVICAVIGVVALISYTKRNYQIIFMGLATLGFMAIALLMGAFKEGSYLNDSHRIGVWKDSFNQVGIQFWGKGLGWVPEIFSQELRAGMRFYNLHSEWVELYAIAGLLGIVVGIYLIIPLIKNRGNSAINACAIALLVNSLGNFTFHIAPLFMIFGTCYALQLAKE